MLSFRERIIEKEESLTASERKIIEQLEKHEKPFLLSMNELSLISNVSEPSVVRLYRKLGYTSYQELKVALAQELAGIGASLNQDMYEIKDDDKADIVFEKIGDQLVKAMVMTRESLDVEKMEEAAKRISEAERLFFFGQGLSGTIAEDGAHKFMRLGGTTLAVKDPHYQAIYASHMTEKDVVIALSHSGETINIIEVVKLCKESGSTVIIITSHPHTTLAKMADILLLTQADETQSRSDAMISRMVQLAFIDTLYTRVCNAGGSSIKKAVNKSRLAVTKMKR